MKVLATLAVFFTASSLASSREVPAGCYDGSISASTCCEGVTSWWVHLPNPEDCGSYYQCVHGTALRRPCPPGLQWSVNFDRCEWPYNARCQVSSSSSSSSSSTSTSSSSSSSTTTTTTTTTESTTTSSPNLQEGCYDGSISADNCCQGVSAPQVHLPDWNDCGRFYQCDNGVAVSLICPAGLHWSVSSGRCDWPDVAQCQVASTTEITTTSEPEELCPSPPVSEGCIAGLLPAEDCCQGIDYYYGVELANNENCSSYYQCVAGRAEPRQCPEGLHWSIQAERCEHPEIARCGNNGEDSSSSESSNESSNESEEVSEDCLYGRVSAEECCKDVPSNEDVLLQNNENCSTYIQCVHGSPVVRPCPANLVWSVTYNRCEWIERGTCLSPA